MDKENEINILIEVEPLLFYLFLHCAGTTLISTESSLVSSLGFIIGMVIVAVVIVLFLVGMIFFFYRCVTTFLYNYYNISIV
jgi:hypothetical protein